jgi:hypothetical protein
MIQDILDILFPTAAGANAFFFFFFFFDKNEMQNEDVKKIMKQYPDLLNREDTQAMVASIMVEKFSERAKSMLNINSPLRNELSRVKKEILEFYLSLLTDIKDKGEFKYVADTHTAFGNYLLRLMRLRLVVDPEIQLSINVHPQSKIKYLAAKSFWLDNEGRKVRKFTKSLGRLDSFKKGKNDPSAMDDAFNKIQEIIYEEYKSEYK